MITTENINLYYGKSHALKNVSMVLQPLSVTALIGPSGCGKSTFLRCINRMNDLIADVKITGEININGKNIYSKEVDVNELRKNVGMVFQKPTPFPKSIYDNVAYGLRVNSSLKKDELDNKVHNALKQAALWDEVQSNLSKSALSLSGGQQQRLCIARAIAVSPRIILMDEPTSALDPLSTLKVEQLIQELKKEYTIVIVTHNMQQAARISDKTAFFYMGEVIEYDNTSKIFNAPANQQTKDYVNGNFG